MGASLNANTGSKIMTAIYLNLADVRNLLLALGKSRSETVSPGVALEIIASGLGVTVKFLTTYCEMT
jgi:hypothetical protein